MEQRAWDTVRAAQEPPQRYSERWGLGEALEEVVKEVVEVVEALGIHRRPLKARLVNSRCKICPAVEACLRAAPWKLILPML